MLFFAAAALAEEPAWHQLRAPAATASSYLKSAWNRFEENYHPAYALDGDPKTAWVEGVAGEGVGEWIAWDVSSLRSARAVKLRFLDGYQKSEALLAANGAPIRFRAELLRDGAAVATQPVVLEPKMGWQEVVIPAGTGFDAVRLTIEQVRGGRTYADTCLSEVELWVDSDEPYVAVLENAKHAALRRWIDERVAAAKAAAAEPVVSPLLPRYRQTFAKPTGDEQRAFEQQVDLLAARWTALDGSAARWRADVKTVISEPDSGWIGFDSSVLRWLSPGLTLFEATSDWQVQRSNVNEWIREEAISTARARLGEDGKAPLEAAWRVRRVIEERSVETTETKVLAQFEGGRLARVYSSRASADESEGCEGYVDEDVTELTWDAQGRVIGTVRTWRFRCLGDPSDGRGGDEYGRNTVTAEL